MKVGHHVAEAREVDLVWAEFPADDRFDSPYHLHQLLAIAGGEVGHLCRVAVEHDPDEAWQRRVVDRYHDAQDVVPQNPLHCTFTQLALSGVHDI